MSFMANLRFPAALLVLASVALPRAVAGADAETASAEPLEEVIIHGRPLADLRIELRRAEGQFFSVFNDLNSDDDYDIHCEGRAPVGSRIKRHVCEASFIGELSSMGYAAMLRGSHAVAPAFVATMRRKERLLFEELRRLVTGHPELMRAYIDLVIASQALRGRNRAGASPAGRILAGD